MTIRLWRVAARLAWRELTGRPARTVFISLTIALSVASISGVHGAAAVARKALEGDSRAWLAGDIGVDTLEPITESQAAALTEEKANGIGWTLVTMASTMAGSDQVADPAFISVKAVDPAAYPFYGKIGLIPAMTLSEALRDDTAVVSEEVLERLQVRLGDTISIARQPFRVAAVIRDDPARFSNDLGLGMRCIVSRRAFGRTRIAGGENSVRNRVLLKLPDGARGRELLETLFPGASIRDYRSGYRQQTEIAITFLSMTALLALALGALGVAVSVRELAEQNLPAMAVVKMLGGRGRQAAAMFFFQIAIIAAAGVWFGAPLGLFVERSVLSMAGRYFVLSKATLAELGTIAGTACVGLLAMAPVLVQPMLLIGRLRPAGVLRKDVETFRTSRGLEAAVAAGISVFVFAGLAYGLTRSWGSAAAMSAVLLAGGGAAAGIATIALRALRRWTLTAWSRRMPVLRHGIAALARPGNRTRMLIVCLAMALAVIVTTYETSGLVVKAVFDLLPYESNGVYIARFKDTHVDELRAFLLRQPGVGSVEMITQARLDLRKVDRGGMFDLPILVVCEAGAGTVLAQDTARQFGARVGSRLTFDARDKTIQATVTTIRKLTPAERVWSNVRLDCSSLDRRTLFHQAVVRVAPERISAVRRAVGAEYPTFAVITPDDVAETVKAVSEDAMVLARLVAWFAIGAGLALLVAIMAASRTARMREVGILTALGARRGTLLKLYTIEFAAIGALAAAIASLITCALTVTVMSLILHRVELTIDAKPIVGAFVLFVVLTVIAGWVPAARLLRLRPMDILRGE